jgi:hypothetical protein
MDYSDEIADGGTTFYSSIAAVDGLSHDTAVFIPDQFHITPTIDLILYLHGHNNTYADLRSYIHRNNTRPLRSAVSADGRFALVIPWLQSRSNAAHIVGSTQAFDMYLDAVVALIQNERPGDAGFAASSSVSLVLSSHSGGGSGMTKAITLSSGYIDHVVSVWGFDCLYSDHSDNWVAWARANPTSSMYVYYTDTGGTAGNSKILDNASASLLNVSVQRTDGAHDEVPKRYFPDLLSIL